MIPDSQFSSRYFSLPSLLPPFFFEKKNISLSKQVVNMI